MGTGPWRDPYELDNYFTREFCIDFDILLKRSQASLRKAPFVTPDLVIQVAKRVSVVSTTEITRYVTL
jgi:hypothetical protein